MKKQAIIESLTAIIAYLYLLFKNIIFWKKYLFRVWRSRVFCVIFGLIKKQRRRKLERWL